MGDAFITFDDVFIEALAIANTFDVTVTNLQQEIGYTSICTI